MVFSLYEIVISAKIILVIRIFLLTEKFSDLWQISTYDSYRPGCTNCIVLKSMEDHSTEVDICHQLLSLVSIGHGYNR